MQTRGRATEHGGRLGFEWVRDVAGHVRRAVRSLSRAPGFTLAAATTLALGIAATTTMFGAVYSVLLKPLPYADPNSLYTVQMRVPQRPSIGALSGRVQDYLEWRDTATFFAGVAAMTPARWNLATPGEAERVSGARVSTDFFAVLGVPLEQGRGFARAEEQPGADRVVVISHGLWMRRFGGDPSVIGRMVDLDGEPHVIVGVAPQSLLTPSGALLDSGLAFDARLDVLKPLAPTPADLAGESWDQALFLRLAPGASVERGLQQLRALLNAPEKALPLGLELVPELVPLRELFARDLRARVLLLFAASTLLLLVACTNIANLILARAATRGAEYATRVALGAGRAAIFAQGLAEGAVLAAFGGTLGVALADAGTQLLTAYGAFGNPGLHAPVLLFALLVTSLTAAIGGSVPALTAHRNAHARLREGARGSTGGARARGAQQLLTGVQMAMAAALLMFGALLLQSFVNVLNVDRGYDVRNALAMDIALSGERYASGPQRVNFFRELTQGVAALPGVTAAGAISDAPVVAESGSQTIFLPTDTDFATTVAQRPVAGTRDVAGSYFAASGSTLVAGRFFDGTDTVATAIVSESLAHALWPRDDLGSVPGRQIRQGDVDNRRAPLLTVVGVVRDVLAGAADRALPPQIYRPHLPPRSDARMTVIVRTAGRPESVAAAVRNTVRLLDSSVAVASLQPLRQVVLASVAERRFQMLLEGLFAGAALLLGAVGVYGVVSYHVAARTLDIGLRVAFGAPRRKILAWVLALGMRPVVAGLVVGIGAAVALATAVRASFFRVEPADPRALVAVAVLLLATAAAACLVPAWRAARLDPMTALRRE